MMKLLALTLFISTIYLDVLSFKLRIILPQVTPQKDDAYICSSFLIPNQTQTSFIKSYESTTNSSIAHHILVYGCSEPFSTEPYYSCERICLSGQESIIFAWAKDAQKFEYPPETGMAVAGNTLIKYLVLQVHYLKKMNIKDSSGIEIQLTNKPPKHLVSIAIMYSINGVIPANGSHVNLDVSCRYDGKLPAYALAFRTHAHTLGRTISGFRISSTNNSQIDLIGIGSPQWPQTFYKANSDIIIMPGDILMARCVFDASSRNHDTRIGSTHHDEMCNFYMMLVSKNVDGQLGFDSCGGDEFPDLWKKVPTYSKEYSKPRPSPNLFLTSKRVEKLTFDFQWKVQYPLGEVSSVAVLHHLANRSWYSLIVLHRVDRYWTERTFDSNVYTGDKTPISSATILEVDPNNGTVLRKAGQILFSLPHGVTITKDGKYIWVTDVALHQVMRFRLLPRDGPELMNDQPDMVLGEKFVPGNDKRHFCKPSKVAVDRQGLIFVADGYCNSRVMIFYPNGTYARELSTKDVMDVVHSITIEEDELGNVDKNIVWVADRENRRVIGFKYDGKVAFISSPTQYNKPIYGIEFNPFNGNLYGVSSNGNTEGDSLVLDSKRNIFAQPWHSNYSLKAPHDLCLAKNGTVIFVAELHMKTVIKFAFGYHDTRAYDNVLNRFVPGHDPTVTMNPTAILLTIFLALLCLLFCLFIVRLFCRRANRSTIPKLYSRMYRDKEGFQPLKQNEDNEGDAGDSYSDPETDEFLAPKAKLAQKPKI